MPVGTVSGGNGGEGGTSFQVALVGLQAMSDIVHFTVQACTSVGVVG